MWKGQQTNLNSLRFPSRNWNTSKNRKESIRHLAIIKMMFHSKFQCKRQRFTSANVQIRKTIFVRMTHQLKTPAWWRPRLCYLYTISPISIKRFKMRERRNSLGIDPELRSLRVQMTHPYEANRSLLESFLKEWNHIALAQFMLMWTTNPLLEC